MIRIFFVIICWLALIGATANPTLTAQNINTSNPFGSASNTYLENSSASFGFSLPGGRGNGSRVVGLGTQGQLLPNLMFQNVGGVDPQFGKFHPNAAASFGFSQIGVNGSGFSLGLNPSFGNNRSSITTAQTLTTQNGFGGSIFSGQFRPFVSSAVPVLGVGSTRPGFNPIFQPDNEITRAIQTGQLDLTHRPHADQETQPRLAWPDAFGAETSTATRGDLSVKQIKAERRRRLAERERRLERLLTEANKLRAQQNFSEARLRYKEALTQTDDDAMKAEIASLIKASRNK